MQNSNEKSKVKVSVCVITYNHAPFIRECIESIINQTTNFNFEIIIRDDASTDETYSIISDLKVTYPTMINILDSSTNLGANRNFIEILKAAQGEYIAICEGDDYWLNKNKIQKQSELLERYQNVDLCCHPSYIKNGDKINYRAKVGEYSKKIALIQANEVIGRNAGILSTPSLMFRRTVFNSFPAWFEKAPVGDYFIQVYCALNGGCLYIPEPMSVYRTNAIGSWSRKTKQYDFKLNALQTFITYLDLLAEELDDQYRELIYGYKSRVFLYLALSAANVAKYHDFKKFIDASWRSIEKGHSIKQKIIYYLRFYPRGIKLLNWLAAILRFFRDPVFKKW